MAGKRTRVGAVQLRILRVLWEQERATARQITEELARGKPAAHSTVQTLLRKLEAKGAVGHHVEDRTFVFYARVTEEEVTRGAARELIGRLFDGQAAGLVAYLLRNESISPEELRELRRLIDRKEGEP